MPAGLIYLLPSLWSEGWALVSILSLLVVTPIVTAYLVYDWNRIILALDNAVPSAQRSTVRALAREIDDKISGYLRGQGVICLMLAAYYVIALRSIGLNHALLIGLISGLIGFVPYVGSLTGLLLSVSIAIVQFGPTWTPVSDCPRYLHRRPICRGLRAGTLSGRKPGALEPCLADFLSVCLRILVRSRRPPDRRAARGIDWCDRALRAEAIGRTQSRMTTSRDYRRYLSPPPWQK